jgi:hypothetical protein
MKRPEAIDTGRHLRKRKRRYRSGGFGEFWDRINRLIDLDRRTGADDPTLQPSQQHDAPSLAKSDGESLVVLRIGSVEHKIEGDHGRAMRRQLLDRAGMQRARPWPVSRRQAQRLGGGAILGDDNNFRRGRQRPPQVEQDELAEPILYSAAEHVRTQQQPGEPSGKRDKDGCAQTGPAPADSLRIVNGYRS